MGRGTGGAGEEQDTMKKTTDPIVENVSTSIRCNAYHSGNRTLAPSVGRWECAGCGHIYTDAEVRSAIESRVSTYTGRGGLVKIK